MREREEEIIPEWLFLQHCLQTSLLPELTPMANPEHVEILSKGKYDWNDWRRANPSIAPDLSYLKFSAHEVPNVREFFREYDFSDADLHGSRLYGVNLFNAPLNRANLSRAVLAGANLCYANLSHANLREADLSAAWCHNTVFKGSDLTSANLSYANITYADFSGATMYDVEFNSTILGYCMLSDIKGLDSCRHFNRNIIDFHTLAVSGPLPIGFLRGSGLPDTIIDYLPSLLNDPIQFYSCFVSYSSKDQDFANRLYADLQNEGVRCWFAPKDLKIGDRFRIKIDESISLYDKLLLVLSENSISSRWVEKEVETAMEREAEDEQHRTILFPVRLDDAVIEIKTGWPADVRRTRHVGDFTNWKSHDSYQRAFGRLLQDLKSEEKKS